MATKDVKMYYTEDDIEKIQTKTNMYIQQYGSEGAFHLAREVIQNAVDECIDPDSGGKNIRISYDHMSDKLISEDDGRGFPEVDYPLDIFCTKIQSGSKFYRDQSGNTAGEFGLGLTAVNALSDQFMIQTYRQVEKYIHTISFESGKKILDKKDPLKSNGKQHGSIISFIPSKKFLGKTTKIPFKDMLEWIESISYQLPEKAKIKIEVEEFKGMELQNLYTFKSQPFENIIHRIVKNPMFTPIVLKGKTTVDDETPNSKKKKNLELTVAFTYETPSEKSKSVDMEIYDSYCNFTNTTDGGVHETAVEDTLCRFLVNATKKSLTDREKEKIDILWADVRSNLRMSINLATNAQVQFVGNAKQKINNEKLIPVMKSIVNSELTKFFEKNQSLLDLIVKIIKTSAKIRTAMNAERVKLAGDRRTSIDDHKMKNLIPCNNRGKKYKEIHLVEGNSASGSATNGRDPYTQAFFMLRGVTANPFKTKNVKEIMENVEWRNFVESLRCGIGSDFDLKKLYYDKIIIMTDADVDGAYISAGIGAFFAVYLPEIVKAGKLYKVYSPLYHINDKQKPFVRTKEEYVSIFKDKIIKNYKAWLQGDDSPMSKKEFSDFILFTVDYSDELIRVSKHYGVNKFLVEFVSAYLTMNGYLDDLNRLFGNQKNITKFMSTLQKTFPEISLKSGDSLRGVIDGKFQSIKINDRFVKKTEELSKVYSKYGYYLKVSENGDNTKVETIGQFLDETRKYVPKIITRYKGLGEADADQLRETTLNPNTRILVRLTMDDVERDLKIFRKLFNQSKKDLDARKDMMREYKIKREDLDN